MRAGLRCADSLVDDGRLTAPLALTAPRGARIRETRRWLSHTEHGVPEDRWNA